MTPGQFFAAEMVTVFVVVVAGSWLRQELGPALRERWRWHREAHRMWLEQQHDAAVRQALTPRRHR